MLRILAVAPILFACCLGLPDHPSNRILDGVDTDAESYTYMASVEYNKNHRCAGSIISYNWILTVAHCVHGLDTELLRVRSAFVIPIRGLMGKVSAVNSTILHPYFDFKTLDYDIALINTADDLYDVNGTDTNIHIGLRLPLDGNSATVFGWGARIIGTWFTKFLTNQTLTIVYFNECKYSYESVGNPVTERMFCAGLVGGGPCQGDSGDPLIYGNRLIGMMSWSYGCGERRFPAVFTDVTQFRFWIESTAGILL